MGQRLGTFWDMSKKTIVEFSRYPVAFVALFAQIFLIIIMFMFATFAFSSPSGLSDGSNLSLIAGVAIYGFITNIFLSFTLWEIGFSIREEQVRGTLESLYLSPANKFANLISRIFAILAFTSIMCLVAVFITGAMVGGLPVENVVQAFVVLGLMIAGFMGIGFFFAGVTILLKDTAQFLVNGLQFFFMIFSAQFFPFAVLPGPLRDYVSRWIPVSYAVDLFRSLLLGMPQTPIRFPELLDVQSEWIIVILFAILSPIVGYATYKIIERRSRAQGTLGEY